MRARTITKKLWLFSSMLCLILICLFPPVASARYYFDLTPSIAVSEDYNDNIFLDPVDEESDYLTTVTPGISLDMRSQHNHLELQYAPTFVWYAQLEENNTVRHLGTLTFGQDLGKYLRLDVTNTLIKSELPIERTEGVEGVRRTREPYWRNVGVVSSSYVFGPENFLKFGYGNNYLENDDPTVDDGTIQTPFADLSYWFNVKNGVDLDYVYTKADFSREVGLPQDDYKGNAVGIRYLHRFTPHTTGYIGYSFTDRNFEGLTQDYKVHDPSVGFDHAFSPDVSLTLGGGYFIRDNEISDDQTGPVYNISLEKRFERGNLQVGGRGGWSENFLEAQRFGFVQYYGLNATIQYGLFEKLNIYGGGSIRQNEDETDRQWKNWSGRGGLRWNFWRWLYLNLDYYYAQRDDDFDPDDFKANQVMLTISASKLFRF